MCAHRCALGAALDCCTGTVSKPEARWDAVAATDSAVAGSAVFLRAEQTGVNSGAVQSGLGLNSAPFKPGANSAQGGVRRQVLGYDIVIWDKDMSLTPSDSPVAGANVTPTSQTRKLSSQRQVSCSSSHREFGGGAGTPTQF